MYQEIFRMIRIIIQQILNIINDKDMIDEMQIHVNDLEHLMIHNIHDPKNKHNLFHRNVHIEQDQHQKND